MIDKGPIHIATNKERNMIRLRVLITKQDSRLSVDDIIIVEGINVTQEQINKVADGDPDTSALLFDALHKACVRAKI